MDAREAGRVRQSANTATSPDRLRELAYDPSVTVRASLAMNPALPHEIATVLAADTDARVREIVGRKMTKLSPSLAKDVQQRMQQDAIASLTALVAEAALRVRTSVAQAVRDMPDGPRDIVLRLAHDPAVMVCQPVILFSPMLTQEDLVTLIASRPPPTTMLAVANRERISEAVSDAIVGTADPEAIRALLANRTAQIREATLDALAAQSEEHTAWQDPLVRRPHLPMRAQRMLAEIVTGHLLQTLAARHDLDPKVTQTLRARLRELGPIYPTQPANPTKPADGGETAASVEARMKVAVDQAQRLRQAGKLDDHAVMDALQRNATASAIAMLAVKAGVDVSAVERACELRSAKAIVSLAWKAGLSAQTATVLQTAIASLAPDQVLRSRDNLTFSLSEDEMRWQIGLLGPGESKHRPWMPRRLS